jgi:hypothetical protein
VIKPTRIYVVIDTNSTSRWLVRAINPHVAQRRVMRERFITRVASQDELIRLSKQGIEVIDGTADAGASAEDLFEEPEPALP